MTVVILGITATMFTDALVNAVKTFTLFDDRKESVFMIDFGINRILKDCRYIKRGYISYASHDRLDFEDAYGRHLSFRLTGSNLEMSMDNGVNYFVLAQYISSLTISYYTKTNVQLADPVPLANLGDIHWIEIRLDGRPEILNYKSIMQVFPREMFR
ncbi:MAG: hypothetical protein JW774_10890 [Candidatus Aureabacteria bacterium]|nr:hypothetical protein [Candidatus Auribacterota bacterium]